MILPLTDGILPLCCPRLLPSEEVSPPKTINIKQYLNTNNFSVNNRHLVTKSSQAQIPLYYKHIILKFNCHGYIKNHFSSEILKQLTFSDSVESHD